jgi:hypothetical protein
MSQVVRAIKAVDTGNRKYTPEQLSPIMSHAFQAKEQIEEVHELGEVLKMYRIEARMGAQVLVNERDAMHADGIEKAIDRTRNMVIEAIFGEFRSHFRLIEAALYNYDYVTARQLLQNMETQMFEVREVK